jgi:hypothetical protein
MPQAPSKKTIGTVDTFVYSLHSVVVFSDVLEAKMTTLPKPGRDPKFLPNLGPISLLPTTGNLFEKVILKIVQRHTEERSLRNAGQFGFRACQHDIAMYEANGPRDA